MTAASCEGCIMCRGTIRSGENAAKKTPFAGGNANSELSTFYRECQTAPQLKIFTEQPPITEQLAEITKTLESCESSIKEYDELLSTLCVNDNNN